MSVFSEVDAVVKAVNSASKDIKDGADSSGIMIEKNIGSISRGASKSIYYFPILMSRNVPPSTMGMIAQNLEGSYMSFVKACFALTPAMNVKDSNIVNVEDYLKLFHQNIGLQTKDELMFSVKSVNENMQEWKMFPNDILNEANTSNVSSIISRNYNNFGTVSNGVNKDGSVDPDRISMATRVRDIEKEKDKINGIRPSVVMVDVTFIIGGRDVKVSIPVGVKTILHPVNPQDLTDHIMESLSGKGLLHNLIRYTTGELHSLSDILFGIEKTKKHIAKGNDVTRWADALERRKNSNKIRNSLPFLQKKSYLPNMSIVVSMEDVSEIERTIGYNLLTDIKRTIKFMKDNFLLSLVISDDVTETLHILYDGHMSFAEFPFASIKRENSKTDNIVDALIKGIGMGRTV